MAIFSYLSNDITDMLAQMIIVCENAMLTFAHKYKYSSDKNIPSRQKYLLLHSI